MSRPKPYADIPGTVIFDADQARAGYHLNQFCMSLMRPDNRARFKRNERAYLDEWPMSDAQKQAVLARDYNRMISLGGNIYFLAKIFSTDGKSFQHAAALMTGMSQEAYAQMMLAGGRSPEGDRYLGESDETGEDMSARITAGVCTSHVPAIGAAIDNGRTGEDYWKPLFAGYEFSKRWIERGPTRCRRAGVQRSCSRLSVWTWCRPLLWVARINSIPPMKAGGRARYPR